MVVLVVLFKLVRFLKIFGSFVNGIFGRCFMFGILSIFWVKIVEEVGGFFLNILLEIGEGFSEFVELFSWLLMLVFKFILVGGRLGFK